MTATSDESKKPVSLQEAFRDKPEPYEPAKKHFRRKIRRLVKNRFAKIVKIGFVLTLFLCLTIPVSSTSSSDKILDYYMNDTQSPATDYAGVYDAPFGGSPMTGLQGLNKSSGEWHDAESIGFDGSNDYLDVPDNFTDLNSGAVSFAFYVDSTGSFQDLFAASSSGGGENVESFVIQLRGTDKIEVRRVDGGTTLLSWKSDITVSPGNWYHITYTVNGSGNRIYLNGQLNQGTYETGSNNFSGFIGDVESDHEIYINRLLYDGSYYSRFDGRIDEFKIYNSTKRINSTQASNIYEYNTLSSVNTVSDTEKPDFDFNKPGYDSTFNTTSTADVEFNISVSDNKELDKVEFYTDADGSWGLNETVTVSGTSSSVSLTKTLPQGFHKYGYKVFDNSSNSVTSANRTVAVRDLSSYKKVFLALGGKNDGTNQVFKEGHAYVYSNSSWIDTPDLRAKKGTLTYTKYRGDVYWCGGDVNTTGNNPTNHCSKYETSHNSIVPITDYPINISRMPHHVPTYNSETYFFGGLDSADVRLNQTRSLDLESLSFSKQADYLAPKTFPHAFIDKYGNVHGVAGSTGDAGGGGSRTDDHFSYNTETDSWSQNAKYPVTMTDGGNVKCFGNNYVMGGWNNSNDKPNRAMDTVYKWDAGSSSWQSAVDLPFDWTHFSTTCTEVESEERMYVFGGDKVVGGDSINEVWYRNETSGWTNATDTAGMPNAKMNFIGATTYVNLNPDKTPPSITVESPQNQTFDASMVDLNVASDEAVSSWVYSLDDASNQTFVPNTTFSDLSDGSHTVDVYATDDAGNTGSESVSFTVSTEAAPSVDVSLNSSIITVNESVEASVSASDDNSVDSVSLDWDGDGNYEETSSGSSLTAVRQFNNTATYSVTARATDNASQTSTDSVELTVNPELGDVNKSVLVSCSSADGDDPFCVENQTTNITFENGFQQGDTINATWTVRPRVDSGSYEFYGFANSTGTHNTYTESSRSTVNVVQSTSNDTGNSAPTPDFSISPSSPVAGETITFDGSSSTDSDGSISAYRWDWTGDGTFEDTGVSVDHTYPSSGDYSVKLQVEDDDGATGTVTQTLTVGSNTTDDGTSDGDTSTGGDDNTTTGGTASLGDTSINLLQPHLKSRYGQVTFTVQENNQTTILLSGKEVTVQVDQVLDKSSADLTIGSTSLTAAEGEQVYEDALDKLYVAEVVQTGERAYVTYTVNKFDPLAGNKGDVPVAYNYSSDGNVTAAIQYRETGYGTSWQNHSVETLNSTTTGYFKSTGLQLDPGIFEVRLNLYNSTDSVSTQPIGFYTGQVPDIEFNSPKKGEVFRRLPNSGGFELPIGFDAYTYNSTNFGGYYVSKNGERFTDKKIDLRDYDSSIPVWFRPEEGTYTEYITNLLYDGADALIGLGPQREISVKMNITGISSVGDYTAYVNASSNRTDSFNEVTTVGRNVQVNLIDPTSTEYVENESEKVLEETGRTVSSSPNQENLTENITVNGTEAVFKNPFYWLKTPSSNETEMPTYAFADMSGGVVDFYFDLGHEGNASLDKRIVVENENQTVLNKSLRPTTASYELPVSGSMLESSEWTPGNYTWYLELRNNDSLVYSTENRNDGEMRFEVKKADNLLSFLYDLYDSSKEIVSGFVSGLAEQVGVSQENMRYILGSLMLGLAAVWSMERFQFMDVTLIVYQSMALAFVLAMFSWMPTVIGLGVLMFALIKSASWITGKVVGGG